MKRIDLNTAAFTAEFAAAPIYAKTGIVKAIRITKEGLKADAYRELDVWPKADGVGYEICTYVMREDHGVRTPALEDTRTIVEGEWIVTNPKAWASDKENNYAMPDETFRKKYEPTTVDGVYRARGMARIIRNTTGEEVEIEAPWGGPQNGDRNCYFCAPYNPEKPEDLAEGDRYILSENDFQAYGLAEEVLK